MQRKQEKLKNNILKEAAEYKALKAQRAAEMLAEEQRNIEIKNLNEKARPKKVPEQNSPAKQTQKRPSVTSPQPREVLSEDEQRVAEQEAEEKKKFEMMRKYYRNRHHTFLAALAEQKKKEEEDQKAIQEAEAKKKAKTREKILGDPTDRKSTRLNSSH